MEADKVGNNPLNGFIAGDENTNETSGDKEELAEGRYPLLLVVSGVDELGGDKEQKFCTKDDP